MQKNIHSRINARANDTNKAKCFGLNTPKEGVFYWSFNNQGNPRHEELYFFQRRPHYNEKGGFYN